MYTVARFLGDASQLDKIIEIGHAMNAVRGEAFTELRPRRDGLACSVSRAETWWEHSDDILGFVAEFGEHIRQAREAGISVTIDVAVEPDDKKEGIAVLVLPFTPAFLSAVAAADLRVEVSVY